MNLGTIAVKNVMTIPPRASVADAAQTMRETHVGDLVVVDDKRGRAIPIGIITDRDISMATVALRISPEEVCVEDVMSSDLITARGDDSLTHVIELMKKNAVKRIPLVGSEGELEGIVTVGDVLNFLFGEFSALARMPQRQRRNEQLKRGDEPITLRNM